MFRNDNRFNCECFNLKHDNFNLKSRISKLQKENSLLQQQKKNLEARLGKPEERKKSLQEFEHLLDKVSNVTVKHTLSTYIENLLSCVTCVVCHANRKSVLYVDCRHLAVCAQCGVSLGNDCPLCRTVSRKIAIYN